MRQRRAACLGTGIALLATSAIAADTPAACVNKSLAETVSCVARASRPDACKALAKWRLYLSTLGTPDAPTVATTTLLEGGCAQEDYLRLADRLRAEGRFDEAFTYYDKITGSGLPDVLERARRGRIATLELKNTLVGPPAPVERLESQYKFAEAYQKLAKAVAATDTHRKNLAALLALFKQAEELEWRDEPEAALKAYTTYLGTLDPVRDRFLMQAANGQIERVEPIAREEATREAEALVAAGDLQMRRGQFTDAAGNYEKSLARRNEIDPELASRANGKLAEARLKAAKEPTLGGVWRTFVAAIPKAGITLIGWAPYFLFLAALFVLIWLVSIPFHRRTRPQMMLSMQDLTAASASAQNDRLLSEQMRRLMSPPMPSRKLRIDTPGEMDGSSLGQLGIRVPLRAVATEFEANTISFGPVTINPFQIVNQLRPLFRPRFRLELEGSVSKQGSDVVCTVRRVFGDLPEGRPRKWEAIGSGDGAQDQALRDAAMQVLIDIDDETRKITVNWRSLSRLFQGMDLLRKASGSPTQRQAFWAQARASFQESVLEDPGNWLARFNLGTVLRKLGFNSLAAEQFGELQLLKNLPDDYKLVVRYNQAAALQKTDDEDLAKQAIAVLDGILSSTNCDPVLTRLAQSGRLAAIADGLARRKRRLRRIGADSGRTAFQEEIDRERIAGEKVLAAVERAIQSGDGANGGDNNVVLAVTLNALGQLEGLLERGEHARARYRRAITLLPAFIEPNLNLAALYVEKKGSLDKNWATRAERLLLDVLAMDANNVRCLVLLGGLYSNPVFGRVDDAVKRLAQAMPDPEAGKKLGGIFFDTGKPADAIAPLLSSVAQDSMGSGQILLTRCALALPADDRRKCELLRTCQKWLEGMQKQPGTRRNKDAEALLPRVQAAVAECAKGKQAAAAVPQEEHGGG